MTKDTGRAARDLLAVLEADLRTSRARTAAEVRRAAMSSLASLDRADQVVTVEAYTSDPWLYLVRVRGPRLSGAISLKLPLRPR